MRGFSLLELILANALLLLATGVVFWLFGFATVGYRNAAGRNALQADAQAALTRIKEDLEVSTLNGCTVDSQLLRKVNVSTLAGISSQPRYLLCMPGMTNWDDGSKYRMDDGMPIWDSFILYHPELAAHRARLFRIQLAAPDYAGQSWPDFTLYKGAYLSGPPPKGTSVGAGVVRSIRALAGNVLGFEATKSSRTILVILRLWDRNRPQEGSRVRDEILEVKMQVQPKNFAF